ncbi:MAG: NAD-dependent malic enzyme [Phycisphaerae bacterium]|nr:NAD-dependent malic enzyme [Phycisphaerae bacterium]|tara:strand:+ start:1000 stop:2631 length:1632 start_codon:yes stop_codon:yes gene_type:complete
MNNEKAFHLLRNPLLNKGSGFTAEERQAESLEGLLPTSVETLETRVGRASAQCDACPDDLARYVYLAHLQDVDETLYFALLISQPDKYMPLVYTPTVGDACLKFGNIFRSTRGLYLNLDMKGRIESVLRNWGETDVRFIVVTDGSRILGLGDLGANGMGIPIGKLALYSAAAGVPPQFTLPIMLDVGTDTQEYIDDPYYLGAKQARPDNDTYYEFLDEFTEAVQKVFPGCCVQFEDFNIHHAEPLLEKYHDKFCMFNDDIQGTAAVATAGIYTACRAKGENMSNQRILFLGAGSAGCGIGDLMAQAMQSEGLDKETAYSQIRLFDINGLLTKSRADSLEPFQRPFAADHEPTKDFVGMIRSFKPTAIIGVSTVHGAFNEDVMKAMCEVNDRPIIFPYSNPTSHSECTAEEAYAGTNGKVLFASGSPFPELEVNGNKIEPSQGNNVYIFPAMGLAVYATKAKRVTEPMFLTAAKALAETLTDEELNSGLLYPPRDRIREVSAHVAAKVAENIFDENLASVDRPSDVSAFIKEHTYVPSYAPHEA